ncbi:MAG TPA: hypothetical protein VFS16_19315 [Acidimicrobiia bacterium]|nr:hypothetical protein [Acidimicrobiia bacterium]
MTSPRPRLAELSREVAGSVNRLVDIAGAAGRPDLGTALVEAARRWPDPQATVVVIGEPRSGRTGVVNALAGTLEPPLLPLGGALTVVRAGTPGAVVVHRPGEEPEERSLASPGDVPDSASLEVIVPGLAVGSDLVIVDAPSVDGPGDPRRGVVEAILATADAVVLVSRADAPLSGHELDLLVAARRRTGAAVLVVTGVDRHRGWRDIVEESRRSVEARGAALLSAAPVPFALPLAADAEVAARNGAPDAAELAEESGLAALRATVRSAIGDRFRLVRLLGLVELAGGVAAEVDAELTAAAPGSFDEEELMAAVGSRLRAARDAGTRAGIRLSDGFTIIRDSLGVDVGREVAAVLEEVEAVVTGDGDSDVDSIVSRAEQALEAARLRVDARASAELEALVTAVMDHLGDESGAGPPDDPGRPGEEPPAGTGPASEAAAEGGTAPARPGVSASMRLRLVQALLSSAGGAAMIGTITSTSALSGAVQKGSMGIGMLVGGVAAAEGFKEARRQRKAADARARIRTVVEQWRAEYLAGMRERLLREQRTQEAALREAVRAQVEEAEAQIAAAKQAARAAADEQRRRARELADAGEAVRVVRARLADLAAQIAAP